MGQKSKRFSQISEIADSKKQFQVADAVELLQKCPPTKFDQSIEFSMKLGVDPRKADQLVRGTVTLPHGTGKEIRVVVLANEEKQKEAIDAGAHLAGSQDIIDKIKGGWTDFDVLVVTPDMMREVGKLGKILGPRGLMPTPKAGTVTQDVAKAVNELAQGKIEYKVDKNSVINNAVGKVSFTKDQLVENIKALLGALHRAKPATAKGVYMKALSVSSTMGPGVKIDLQSLDL